MKFEDMKLAYGYPLQVQTNASNGQPERFSCRLIGCLPERSILLSVPKVAGKLVRFHAGQKIVTRLMVDNGIGIFASVVESQTADPYPILHIAYPNDVSFKGIRGATRVAIDQVVSVTNLTNGDNEIKLGAIVDISISGARIEIGELIGDIGDQLQLKMQVNITGIVRVLAINAIIRSRVEAEAQPQNNKKIGMTTYGIQFIETDEDKLLLLYAYVYAQLGSEEIIG
jgi:c-di-GMP-binding flagellar brake protein YcgR